MPPSRSASSSAGGRPPLPGLSGPACAATETARKRLAISNWRIERLYRESTIAWPWTHDCTHDAPRVPQAGAARRLVDLRLRLAHVVAGLSLQPQIHRQG